MPIGHSYAHLAIPDRIRGFGVSLRHVDAGSSQLLCHVASVSLTSPQKSAERKCYIARCRCYVAVSAGVRAVASLPWSSIDTSTVSRERRSTERPTSRTSRTAGRTSWRDVA